MYVLVYQYYTPEEFKKVFCGICLHVHANVNNNTDMIMLENMFAQIADGSSFSDEMECAPVCGYQIARRWFGNW